MRESVPGLEEAFFEVAGASLSDGFCGPEGVTERETQGEEATEEVVLEERPEGEPVT